MAGLRLLPAERWDIGLDVMWTASDASLDPLQLAAPDRTTPNQSWDFSEVHDYSNLDITWIEASLNAKYEIRKSFWLNGGVRYADWDDDEPYLYDQTGSLTSFSFAIGKKF
ncbi:MAG: hypothetical protein R3338_12635 [Thermoanaerobaculia bacterium]|nr:hypothetical protein [Thermoanaerobaculia bacterium]